MTYADQVIAWKQSAPVVKIPIGRYTLTYRYGCSYESNWENCWVCLESAMYDLDWDDTPESKYFAEIGETLKSSIHDIEHVDEILEAMKKKPFQGESVCN